MVNQRKKVLMCGGAGYIGLHTAIQLLETDQYDVIIVDSLINSCQKALDALLEIARDRAERISFADIDLADFSAVEKIKKLAPFDAAIHFAALKSVGESVSQPLRYYRNNINSIINVLQAMDELGIYIFVFSSSATVYQPNRNLLKEDFPLGASNPYGQTKVIGEQICRDIAISNPKWSISILRYFNPIGAHPSGKIGEAPEIPLNILPIIQKVAVGKQECVNVCGDDWPTHDGTGVRDYVHVMDLADGHVKALQFIEKKGSGVYTHNLGTGKGVSVLEMIKLFEKASGKQVPYKIVGRRPGDLDQVVCDPSKANEELGFQAIHSTMEACEHAWKWQSTHPDGFRTVNI